MAEAIPSLYICDCDGKFHLALFLFRPLTLNLTSDLLDSPYLLYRRSLALGVGLSEWSRRRSGITNAGAAPD